MHANQLVVPVQAVRKLVDEQFPRWRELSVRSLASQGTVNALFRIGEEFLARFPLQPADVEATRRWLQAEARAARELLGRTRFPTPEPVALGEPGAGYPLPWSVQTWLPGTVATDEDPGGSIPFARDLAEFIGAVRAIGTRGRTFSGTGRGGELRSHDGLGPADPALDLVGAWHLLDAGPRRVLRDDLECGDLEWARGKVWAFEQSMGLVWYYAESNPAMSLMGRRTLQRIMADTSSS